MLRPQFKNHARNKTRGHCRTSDKMSMHGYTQDQRSIFGGGQDFINHIDKRLSTQCIINGGGATAYTVSSASKAHLHVRITSTLQRHWHVDSTTSLTNQPGTTPWSECLTMRLICQSFGKYSKLFEWAFISKSSASLQRRFHSRVINVCKHARTLPVVQTRHHSATSSTSQ